MLMLMLLLLLEREMREEFSFEEEEDILYTNFQKFSPVHNGQSFKKKREHAEERERESCVCRLVVSFFLSTLLLNKIK